MYVSLMPFLSLKQRTEIRHWPESHIPRTGDWKKIGVKEKSDEIHSPHPLCFYEVGTLTIQLHTY